MKDNQSLEVSTNSQVAIDIINKATEILFKKKSGIDELLLTNTDNHTDCPLLQIYTAIIFFFSFSRKIIEEKIPIYLNRINESSVNEREHLHYIAMRALQKINLYASFEIYKQIVKTYPQDRVAILMLETCGFLTGQITTLEESYQHLFKYHYNDPDFLGSLAFLYCHLNRSEEAGNLINQALINDPHNVWLHHVYAHTINEENLNAVTQGIKFLESCAEDWPKQSRFFEGHNWMHLCMLYLKQGGNIKLIFNAHAKHIWGKAKSFNFEQNNAFLVLWHLELAGVNVAVELWQDLAQHATQFVYDYFTPYLTITAILTVARASGTKMVANAVKALERYIKNLPDKTKSYQAWHEVAIPALKGCLAYLDGDNNNALEYLEPIYVDTHLLGHSDEQRSIFSLTYLKAKELF